MASITQLFGELCQAQMTGLSWRFYLGKRRLNQEQFKEKLKRIAYDALFVNLFRDEIPLTSQSVLHKLPVKNKILLLSFNMRVAGMIVEADQLEELTKQLEKLKWLPESDLNSVLELLVELAGTGSYENQPPKRDYFQNNKYVGRNVKLQGYDQYDVSLFESGLQSLLSFEDLQFHEDVQHTLQLMDAKPGTGLPGIGLFTQNNLAGDKHEKDTRVSLFGALVHSRTYEMEIKLDVPALPDNIDMTGLKIRVPQSIDQSEDEGFQSSSNLTPDSQSEPSSTPDIDLWNAVLTYEPSKYRCWEQIGCPPGKKEEPYLTEAGREAFDKFYRLCEGELQLISGTQLQPTPVVLRESELVKDVLNVLIGVASGTFSLNQMIHAFIVKQGVYVSGTSPESMYSLLSELAEYGTNYTRLSCFSLQPILDSTYKKGLVFQAFTSGLRKYVQYYRACVLSTPPSLSLLTIAFLFRKLGRQLKYLSELCGIGSGVIGLNRGSSSFPTGVKLLSFLYEEALSNCSNEHYPVLLSLLKSSCEPYTKFVYEWVYSGICRDAYGEFLIQVNEDYLGFRDKHYWTNGYVIASKEVEESVPLFLAHMANDIFICGKTINLLRLCCSTHYICWSDIPVPRISVTFSLEELEEIERECAVYFSRMEKIADHCSITRAEKKLRIEIAREELFVQTQRTAKGAMETFKNQLIAEKKAVEAKKLERFLELKSQYEKDLEHKNAVKNQEAEEDFMRTEALNERVEKLKTQEQELEKQARQQLIKHYDKLSEEAAKREQKAKWKTQRYKLDPVRVEFLLDDKRKIEDLLEIFPLGEQRTMLDIAPAVQHQEPLLKDFNSPASNIEVEENEYQVTDSNIKIISESQSLSPTAVAQTDVIMVFKEEAAIEKVIPRLEASMGSHHLPNSVPKEECLLDINIEDFLPKVQIQTEVSLETVTQSSVLEAALEEIGSELTRPSTKCLGTSEEGVYDFSSLPVSAPDHMLLPEVDSRRSHGHPSDSHITVGMCTSESQPSAPDANVHSHVSDSSIKVGEYVSDFESPNPRSNIHGHVSESNMQVGGFVSTVEPSRPRWNIHGHVSRSKIQVGEYVSDVEQSWPQPNVHGHASQANLQVGNYTSNVEPSCPHWNIHGHVSDANVKVGDHVWDVEAPKPRWNVHGHASDSHIPVGENVSNVETPAPRVSPFGQVSQSNISIGQWCPEVQANIIPKQRATLGHSSDSTIQYLLYNQRRLTVQQVVRGKANAADARPINSTGVTGNVEGGKLVTADDATNLLNTELEVNGNLEDKAGDLQGACINEVNDQSPDTADVMSTDFQDEEDPIEIRRKQFQEQNKHGHHSDSTAQNLIYPVVDQSHPVELAEDEDVKWNKEQAYLKALTEQYCIEQYQDSYELMSDPPISHLLQNIKTASYLLPLDPSIRRATDETAVHTSDLVSLPVLMKHSITAPLVAHVSLVNKAIVDYFFVERNIEQNFEALRHFLLMEDGEFAQSLSDLLFEKLGSGQTPGEILNPLVLNSILNKSLQYSLHGDSQLASNLTFALKYLPDLFKPNAPDALSCLELRYKVDWPLNIVITESCMNKYNKMFSFLLQLKHMVWTLKDVWFHLKRTALVNHSPNSVQFRQLQLFRHEMQHFVKVIQGYIANQILHVTWCEFRHKLSSIGNLDELHRTHAEYLNKGIFRGLLTEKAAPVMNIIHNIFSLILKFRNQLMSQAWEYDADRQMAVHPNFIVMQQSHKTFKHYSHFLFKVVTKLVNRGYQPHLEDFLLRINFNNYYRDV